MRFILFWYIAYPLSCLPACLFSPV